MKPVTKLGALPKHSLEKRLLYCAAMLHINGFLTDAERQKVHGRMLKWKARKTVGKNDAQSK